ncbi:high mobility group nucleosome-binding domain-containing protein 5-like [Achroia grisella]|uniref:high mobility group nucleosome-binding domain-containing protein 5-like n=1 Tax=Achroia grisella TaxID=688607 RepID=UPI0027D20E41|nr:high mobility group nucleosome-binding domain-containing protein 5-like [Achroia grisella]
MMFLLAVLFIVGRGLALPTNPGLDLEIPSVELVAPLGYNDDVLHTNLPIVVDDELKSHEKEENEHKEGTVIPEAPVLPPLELAIVENSEKSKEVEGYKEESEHREDGPEEPKDELEGNKEESEHRDDGAEEPKEELEGNKEESEHREDEAEEPKEELEVNKEGENHEEENREDEKSTDSKPETSKEPTIQIWSLLPSLPFSFPSLPISFPNIHFPYFSTIFSRPKASESDISRYRELYIPVAWE